MRELFRQEAIVKQYRRLLKITSAAIIAVSAGALLPIHQIIATAENNHAITATDQWGVFNNA